jgi:predicted nucleic acid-binding protein
LIVVVDASVVIAAFVDSGDVGRWAERQLGSALLVAPHLMPAEAANVLRRAEYHGKISPGVADLAYHDLSDLPVELHPFEPFAARVWELRGTITSYDAWYVAVAEFLDATLVTLDVKLSRAARTVCRFSAPPN